MLACTQGFAVGGYHPGRIQSSCTQEEQFEFLAVSGIA